MTAHDRDTATEVPGADALDLELADLRAIPDPLDAGAAAAPVVAPSSWGPPAWGPSPTRADARRWRVAAALLAVAWLAGVVLLLGLRIDLGDGATRTLVQIVVPAVAGALVIGLALSTGRTGLGSRTGRLVAALAVAAVGFPVAALLGSGALLDPRPDLVRGIAACAALVLLLGGVPLLAIGAALRRAFAANAGWRSVLVAAGAGLFGAAALGTHCSTHCGLHMALGHGLPAVVLALAGGVLLGRVTRA